MQISDDIQVVQGSLGSGKSMYAMEECALQLKAGGVIATNFTLVDEWAWRLAAQDLRVQLGIRDRLQYAESLYSRAFRIGKPQSIIDLSGPRGVGLADLCEGKLKTAREGKGLLVLDDCHHFFNSRTFTANKEYVRFFANARKYGWRTLLITHDVENIDKQIRSYIEIEARFRNLQKVKMPFLPFPMCPFPCFVVIRKYYGLGPGSGSKHSMDLYPINKRLASMYDTLERFGEEEEPGDVSHQGVKPSEYVTPEMMEKSTIVRRLVRKMLGKETKNDRQEDRKMLGGAECYPQYHQIVRP